MSAQVAPPASGAHSPWVLDVADVTCRIGGRAVLDAVSLSVRAGEVVSIIGPNGAGKSTLLAVIAGDRAPDTGQVRVMGRPLDGWRVRELARQRAVLLQDAHVAFPYRAHDVVRMGRAAWRGRPEAEQDEAIIARSLAEAEVQHLAEREVTTLSGGERGRVHLARVRAQDTPLLLLDEPTAALDIRHQESTLALCRARAAEGAAVVVVLHDLDVAASYSDRVVVLHRGRVHADGPPDQVCTSDLLSAVYDWPIDVLRHPGTGRLLVLPQRGGSDRSGPGLPAPPSFR